MSTRWNGKPWRWIRLYLPAAFVAGLGLVELSSIRADLAARQAIFLSVGLLWSLSLAWWISLRSLLRSAFLIYGGMLLGLVIVLLVGDSGPRRWFSLGAFSLQPSEFAKVALVLLLAALSARGRGPREALLGAVAAGVAFLLVVAEPDLATAGVFLALYGLTAFLTGMDGRVLLFLFCTLLASLLSFVPPLFLLLLLSLALLPRFRGVSGLFAGALALWVLIVGLFTPWLWNRGLQPYQRRRIVAFLFPERFRKDYGWQALQSRIALGSGGIWGKGYRRGTQKDLAFLPEAHTDFIFSSIGEEFGLVGTLSVLLAFFSLLFLLLMEGHQARAPGTKGVIYGTFALFFFQGGVNLASVLGLFPVAGLPLPLASYGGSHLLAEFTLLGLVAAGIRER